MENNQAATAVAPVQTASQDANSEIRKEVTVNPIVVSRLYAGNYQKEGTLTAELKQTIETKSFYPTKSVRSNLQDNPFADADFGFESTEYDSQETRVAWIDVPASAFDTEEKVAAHMAKLPNACIYKVMSNRPSISDKQQGGITAGYTTLDIIANTQVVRYPKDTKVGNVDVSGKLILDVNGKVQYRAVYYSNTPKEDVDMRTSEPSDVYITPEIQAELALKPAMVQGQTITI